MNRKKKHYGILIAAYILIVCLILLGQQSEVTGFFLLLLLPLILLASMLEDVIGAFIFTLLAALTVVGCYLNAWLPQSIAIVQVAKGSGLRPSAPAGH